MTSSHATRSLVAVLCAATLATSSAGQVAAPPAGDPPMLVTVSAEASVKTIHPGDKFLLAFHFEITPQWHIYWENPGDTGAATEIDVTAPDGFEVGEILWQRPLAIPGQFLTYGYEDQVTLLVPVKAPAPLPSPAARFEARLDWLVCQDICLSGSAELAMTIDTSDQPRPGAPDGRDESESEDDNGFEHYRFDSDRVRQAARALPRDLAAIDGATITREGARITISGPAHGEETLTFFDNHSPGVASRVVQASIENDRFILILEIEVNQTATLDQPPLAAGVIALGIGKDGPSYSFEVRLEK